MTEKEIESTRLTENNINQQRIDVIEKWFRFEYPARLTKINRYEFLGIKHSETRFSLEQEAYSKENELRSLKGLEPLPEIKFKNIF